VLPGVQPEGRVDPGSGGGLVIPRWRPGRRRRGRDGARSEREEVIPLSEMAMTPEMWDQLARASLRLQEQGVPPIACPACGRDCYSVNASGIGRFLIPARVTFGDSGCPTCGSRW
jgi:hypothetical protein